MDNESPLTPSTLIDKGHNIKELDEVFIDVLSLSITLSISREMKSLSQMAHFLSNEKSMFITMQYVTISVFLFKFSWLRTTIGLVDMGLAYRRLMMIPLTAIFLRGLGIHKFYSMVGNHLAIEDVLVVVEGNIIHIVRLCRCVN